MLTGEELLTGKEIRFPATLAGVDAVADSLDRALASFPEANPFRFGILVGFREALLNAVVHGSALNPRLSVGCRLRYADRTVSIEVWDEGPGFSWQDVPHTPPEGCTEGGRGFSIIHSFFDGISYNKELNCLALEKKIP